MMPRIRFYVVFLFCLLLLTNQSFAIPSSRIANDLEKLGTLGRVLYIAAHPDDENTKVISYLSNFKHLKVGYLSLTRGSGGQNLIGVEQFPALGFIRTEELLGARKIDGGEQFFSRALDFGFSKTAEETLSIWPREEILSDIVYAIRKFRPDVIITRFAPDTPGHGHHKASAILAREAFLKAGNPKEFPDQLKNGAVEIWQARKLFHNKPFWLQEDYSKDHTLAKLNIGDYDFIEGRSNAEIAARSRTMHQSQGFGSKPELGDQIEYFEPLEIVSGDKLDIFGGFDFSLDTLNVGLAALLNEIKDNFDFRFPFKSVPKLLELKAKFSEIKNNKIREEKLREIDKIIFECLGVSARIEMNKAEYNLGEDIEFTLNINNPSETKIAIKQISFNESDFKSNKKLGKNENLTIKNKVKSKSLTIPIWLKRPTSMGAYEIKDVEKRNMPSDDILRSGEMTFVIGEHELVVPVEAGYYSVDPIRGEVRSYVSVLLGDYQKFTEDVSLVGEENVSKKSGSYNGKLGLVTLNYDHFPTGKFLVPSKTYNLNLTKVTNPKRIAYIQGSGDQNPDILRKMGFFVVELSKDEIGSDDVQLNDFDVVVLGIRALNVLPDIGHLKNIFKDFMEKGGVVIVQYSTSNRISKIESQVWPYEIEIGNLRVTDEKAEPRLLKPENLAFSSYYKIEKNDFENWVQERGLYFATTWDDRYEAPISFADSGEEELAGGLLIASIGKGYFVYTGLSFFRQLPAGVDGAAKLFTNLIYLADPKLESN